MFKYRINDDEKKKAWSNICIRESHNRKSDSITRTWRFYKNCFRSWFVCWRLDEPKMLILMEGLFSLLTQNSLKWEINNVNVC